MIGKPNSGIEADVYRYIKSYLRKKGINAKVSMNPNYLDMNEFLNFPEKYFIDKKMFEQFCQVRTDMYEIENKLSVSNLEVNPRRFSFDIVIEYQKKMPLFIELNNFYHYYVISGKNDYSTLGEQFKRDFAKKTLIENMGCKFLEIRTCDVDFKEYISRITKEI